MYNYICVQPSHSHTHADARTHTHAVFNLPAHVHKLRITQTTFQVRCSVLVFRLIFSESYHCHMESVGCGCPEHCSFVRDGPLCWPSDLLPPAFPQLEVDCGAPVEMLSTH